MVEKKAGWTSDEPQAGQKVEENNTERTTVEKQAGKQMDEEQFGQKVDKELAGLKVNEEQTKEPKEMECLKWNCYMQVNFDRQCWLLVLSSQTRTKMTSRQSAQLHEKQSQNGPRYWLTH